MMKRFLLILLAAVLGPLARADWADQFSYRIYSTAEGLCDDYVLSTYKDRTGYLWVSTSDGLDRFDGNRFIHFNSHASDPALRIENDFVYQVAEDGSGNIWVTSNSGLCRISVSKGSITYSKDLWTESDLLSQPSIGIQADGDRLLWVLHRDGIVSVRLDEDGNVLDAEKFTTKSTTLRFISASEQDIWVGGFDGIECFRKKTHGGADLVSAGAFPELAGIRDVSTVMIHGNYLWIGTEDGLFCFNVQTHQLASFTHDENDPSSLSDDHVTCLAADASGDIIIGTTRGIDHFERGWRFSHITQGRPRRSLNTTYVNHILMEKDGTMWVSTLVGGINQISPRVIGFTDLLSVTEGRSNIISCSFEDRDGNLLMGVLGKGLGIRKAGEETVRIHSLKANGDISQDDLFVIRQDHNGDYWIATRNDGLIRLRQADLDHPRFTVFGTGNSAIASNHIFDLEYDPVRKGIWYCTNDSLGFLDIDRNSFHRIWLSTETEYPTRFHCLFIDSRHRLWAGGYGLTIIDLERNRNLDGTFEVEFLPSLENPGSGNLERITSIVETPDGTIFAGSHNNGVYVQAQDGTFSPIPINYGQFRSRVTKLISDLSGDVWIGTTGGIYNYAPRTGLLSHFTTEDGLPSNHCYIDSGYRLSDGRITFGTTNGLILFNTPFVRSHNTDRTVTITGIVHKNAFFPNERTGRLDVYPANPSFEIYFSSLDLSHAPSTLYAYRIDGMDEDWTVNSAGSVRYNNLKPGDYTFRVRCTNADNTWSEEETLLRVKVHPRFYQTPWFWSLLFLLVLSAIFYMVYLNFRGQRIKQQELARQVDEKTADLKQAMQDILESKESIEKQNVLLEEQKSKLEEYSARMDKVNREKLLLYTQLTHEFKTPLSLILGPVSELASTNKDREMEPALQIIERNSKYLLSLVNQILDLRRVDSGQVKVHHEAFNIARLSDIYALDYGTILKDRDVSFQTNTRMVHKHILSDRDIINKILSNLVSNAVKHTPDGGKITLSMAQFPRPEDGQILQYLSVTNTGSYIPPAEMDKIFDLFYKIGDKPGNPAAGQSNSGIGLYLVRQLVQALNGEIRVKSREGWGTSFRVLFPVDLVYGKAVQDDIPYTPPEDENQPVLLLVEDNDDMRAYIKAQLSGRYHIAEAANGEKGFDLAKKIIPDFIISDLMMPVCDGLEFCRMIRADSALSHIPFLMLTALSDDDARLSSYKEGVDAFLVKPFDKEMLLTRIENILSNRKQQQSELSFDLKSAYANVNIESSDKTFMENLLNILKDHYENPEFNVPQLQSLMCMSMTPFYKKISALTGLTPALFIRLYRLQTAKKMLDDHAGDKGISVSEIAYMVGFNDPKYFSKCFQNQYHVLPSAILAGEAGTEG
jgi:signal transduction histidine kinase/ligand-binding sensor domain-containing protein/DNA-binding response OmpR family regulator